MIHPSNPGETPKRAPQRVQGRFKVQGTHVVFGVEPGGVVELDLPVAQVNALIEGGFLVKPDPEPELKVSESTEAPVVAADNN